MFDVYLYKLFILGGVVVRNLFNSSLLLEVMGLLAFIGLLELMGLLAFIGLLNCFLPS